jgi:hypothetical protein
MAGKGSEDSTRSPKGGRAYNAEFHYAYKKAGGNAADFRQVGRRSRIRDLTKHLATDAEILRSHF